MRYVHQSVFLSCWTVRGIGAAMLRCYLFGSLLLLESCLAWRSSIRKDTANHTCAIVSWDLQNHYWYLPRFQTNRISLHQPWHPEVPNFAPLIKSTHVSEFGLLTFSNFTANMWKYYLEWSSTHRFIMVYFRTTTVLPPIWKECRREITN